MCKVKGCARPSFVGGLCGFHALEGWCEKRQRARRMAPTVLLGARCVSDRRRSASRPPNS